MLTHSYTQKLIKNFLASPSHAVILVGSKGTGKGFIAKHIASSLLESSTNQLDMHPYVLYLNCEDAKVGIDEVREIQQFLSLSVPGKKTIRRIVILENIEKLRHEAQNALLKTLEEAPTESVIIATISRPDKLLLTIHSRMQQIHIKPVGIKEARKYFESKYSNPDIERAYFISDGCAGLMCSILEQNQEHELVRAINEAKITIGLPRYMRMVKVDSLIKQKEIDPALFLDGMYRLLHASYKQNINKKKPNILALNIARLKLIEDAVKDLEANVSGKLVFSRLFYNL